MPAKVVHCKQEKYDVYIGRPSKWGNPFSHLLTKEKSLAKYQVTSRLEAVRAFEVWITTGAGMYLLDDLHELEDKILGCWCHPLPCHGDILLKLANKK